MAFTQKQYLDAAGLSAFWEKVKAYINAGDANAGGLTLEYKDKAIALKRGDDTLSSFSAADFIKDSFLQSGELITEEVEGVNKTFLKLTLITVQHPGTEDTDPTEQVIKIDVSQLVDAGAIDALAGRVTALEAIDHNAYVAADNTLKSEITTAYKAADAEITTAYQAADTEINKKIADLDKAYKDADTTLKSEIEEAYQAADTALDGKITTLNGKVADLETADTTINGKITALDKAYKDADAAIKDAATALTSRVTALEAIDHNAYKAADTALETKITNAYEDADAALDGKITALNGKVADLETADATINDSIDNLDDAYKAADTAITEAYQAADTALEGKINDVYAKITAIPTEYINGLFATGGA